MSFEAPELLAVLAVVPLAAIGYWLLQRRATRFAVRYTNLDVLASVAAKRGAWRRHMPFALVLASLAALGIAFARPTVDVRKPNERASVVLLVDVSGSMRANDVKPTRLAAAKQAMLSFLERAPDSLRVGLVSFSDEAQVVVSPTVDRKLLEQGIDVLGPGFGTAIGDGLARAVELARTATGDAPPPGETGEAGAFIGAGARCPGPIARVDPAALRRSPDARPAQPGSGRRAGADRLGSPSSRSRSAPTGARSSPALPARSRSSPCRPTARRSPRSRSTPAASRSTQRAPTTLENVYAGLGSRVGREERPSEVTALFVAAGALLLAGAAGTAIAGAPRLP